MAPSSLPQLSNFALRSILEKDRLNGNNFTNWYRNMRIVLKHDKKEHVLDTPLPDETADDASFAVMGFSISEEFTTDIILNSLPSAYGQFVSNYHMHGMDKKLTELHGMLKTAEADIRKGTSQVLVVQNKPKFKKSSWTKKKKTKSGGDKGNSVSGVATGTKSESSSVGSTCFFCKEEGHWKRNCNKYLAEKGKGGSMTSHSGTIVCNVIDIYLAGAPSSSWVYDTGSVLHICNSLQGLVRTRSVARGEVDICVGNKARVAALEVGTMQLHLPSGFLMELNNCYYVLVLSRNIISASCLMR